MAGRPRQFDEEDVIQKATDVFWEKGYEATSAEDLLKAMNMGKGSFYLHFKGGKEELFRRSMEFRAKQSMNKIKSRFLQSENKLEVIRSLFLERLASKDYFRNYGCLFGNTLVEMANINEELKSIAAEHLGNLEKVFEEVIADAIEKKQFNTSHSPKFIAKHLINTWNGMNITKRMGGQDELLTKIVKMNLKIIE
ncbi:TetR/AcrR family transcriptional regulator [Flammeovirgaceae bacterium SG7u.111]|nr:TetR/AcrR family transcriptional regulator [Flammeovirgaceae bacterium SG7u.132]WPO33536.1 TetR/AcrR family transcriptional regulator [Flammeovirgaceae bacterium SG7u.111]